MHSFQISHVALGLPRIRQAQLTHAWLLCWFSVIYLIVYFMMQHHPKANDWRGKPCLYYENLCIIFGKDRATGQDAQVPEDIEDEVNEEAENDESS